MLTINRKTTLFLVLIVLIVSFSDRSEALLISGTGYSHNSVDPITGAVTTSGTLESREIIQAPDVFGLDLFNTQQQAFNERDDYILTSDLQYAKKDDIIPAGTMVDSHIIFFNHRDGDRDHLADSYADYGVTWVFDAPILGVIFDPRGRRERDSYFLGAENTIYPYYDPSTDTFDADWSMDGRGLESRRDLFYFTPGSNELIVNMFVQSPGDYLRVITVAHTPEPATMVLLVTGIIGLVVARRKYRNR